MLGQFTGEEQTDSSLDLSGGDGGASVVVGKTAGLSSNALEDVIDKAVHDGHSFAGDASVGMDLLEHFVDVDAVALLPAAFLLLVPLGDVLLGLSGLLRSFPSRFWSHTSNNKESPSMRQQQQQ